MELFDTEEEDIYALMHTQVDTCIEERTLLMGFDE